MACRMLWLAAAVLTRSTSTSLFPNDQGAAYIFASSGGVWTQQQELTANNGPTYHYPRFGYSVGVYGDTAVIGAPNTKTGVAYIFVRNNNLWTQQQEITASDGAASDSFGWSVAISKDTVVIGAPFKTVASQPGQGAAYVFVRNGNKWQQQQELKSTDGVPYDHFGWSVSVNENSAIIGAPTRGADRGAAYIFVRDNETWHQQQELTASASYYLGTSVAIGGETAVMGALGTEIGSVAQGAAYVFVRNGDTWTQQQELTASDGSLGDNFGNSVAISGDTTVIGAYFKGLNGQGSVGAAYVFFRSGGVWTQQQELTASDGALEDFFGASVSISGNNALIGASNKTISPVDQVGAAYIFVRSGTQWTQRQEFTPPDGNLHDQFGNSVAISGGTAVVGAYERKVDSNAQEGSVYVFVH